MGELVVIISGILIALAADSWWQGRQDARLERQYLEAFKLDVEQTAQEIARVSREQSETQQDMMDIAADIADGEPLPDTILRVFPSVTILGESMDTYRDLVASGGTTRISSLAVRRSMSRLLRSVEYSHLAEAWALDVVTSLRAVIWAAPRPVPRDRLADMWATYTDLGDRLVEGHARSAAAADSALAVLTAELNR